MVNIENGVTTNSNIITTIEGVEYRMGTKDDEMALKKLYAFAITDKPEYMRSRKNGDDWGFEIKKSAILKVGGETAGFMAMMDEMHVVYRYAELLGLNWEEVFMVMGHITDAHQGNGYSTELLNFLLAHAKNEQKKKQVIGVVCPENEESMGLSRSVMNQNPVADFKPTRKRLKALEFRDVGLKEAIWDQGVLRAIFSKEL